jgi:hypothetical protein
MSAESMHVNQHTQAGYQTWPAVQRFEGDPLTILSMDEKSHNQLVDGPKKYATLISIDENS